jgi:ABC-type multidrug transport system fused ATPase/permease subunit
LFNLLRFPLQVFPEVLNASIKALISTRRIDKFLNAENVRGLNDKSFNDNNIAVAIEMKHATFGWKTNNEVDDVDASKETNTTSCYRSMLHKCYSNSNSNTNGYKHVPLSQSEEESMEAAIELTSDVNINSNAKYSIFSNDDNDDDGRDNSTPELSHPKHSPSPSFDNELDENSPIIEVIVLEDVTISIPKGSLAVIIGSTGSGKSSIISALLGENYLAHGSTSLNGIYILIYIHSFIHSFSFFLNL